MKNISIRFMTLFSVIAGILSTSCQKDPATESQVNWEDGAILRMTVGVGPDTRLAELPSTDSMTVSIFGGKDYGLKNIGLYVYYSDDYDQDDLSKPYIRNLECTVENGMLYPQGASGEDRNIYIYDRMTVVAFYPYNAEMSLEENWFEVSADEENYPITREIYADQKYIPYRAITTTNPTVAYYTSLWFYPKHTYKLEITLVASDLSSMPPDGDIRLLPERDPVENSQTNYVREWWWDKIITEDNGGGGRAIKQYVAYIWTKENEHENNIEMGDVLLQGGDFTLIASTRVAVQEQVVYRYGYNLDTGEIFIPTSSFIIHDRPTLEAMNGHYEGSGYQACDIDLSVGGDWKPLTMFGGRFDGGGHKILNMSVNSTGGYAGLFGQVKGNAVLCNINLVDPFITVSNPSDTVYAGGIAGRVNAVMTEEEKNVFLGNLPPDLSPVVKEALIQEMLGQFRNSQTNVVACKVDNPTINVTGKVAYVGSFCGSAGDMDEDDSYRALIWDCYTLDGSITVNDSNRADNNNSFIGGFCGLNNGNITASYTTIDDITAFAIQEQVQGDGTIIYIPYENYEGFANMGTLPIAGSGLNSDFAVLADSNGDVALFSESWPGWGTYTGYWPILYLGWLGNQNQTPFWYDLGARGVSYPILQWERR